MDLDPAFHFNADPGPTFQFDSDPDLVAPMLQNDPLRLLPFDFDADPDPGCAFFFDADPDQNEDPTSQNDADHRGRIRIRNTGYA
jgi:hypothetical protein